MRAIGCWVLVMFVATPACGQRSNRGEPSSGRCGPHRALVNRAVDGDTIELTNGLRIRYLMVDSPELGEDPDCFSEEAARINALWVEGQEVSLEYDQVCRDRFGRLLAYVFADGRMVNESLAARGLARFLYIAPNDRYRDRLQFAVESAREQGLGLWVACRP